MSDWEDSLDREIAEWVDGGCLGFPTSPQDCEEFDTDDLFEFGD